MKRSAQPWRVTGSRPSRRTLLKAGAALVATDRGATLAVNGSGQPGTSRWQ